MITIGNIKDIGQCFWDMHSKGTRHNFQLAKTYGTALKVFNTRQHCFLDEKLIDKLN